ncbi:hypothetical protein TNCV_4118471 [Trichonephila clavipes]|nr:hypothetical protein TNCV_4118471 [Trichonephila clavipes]
MIIDSMGTTNHHRTWGRKPRLVEENRDNSRRSSTMHHSISAHFLTAVRNHLHATCLRKWIGCRGPVAWPPSFPDLNLMTFSFWDYLK